MAQNLQTFRKTRREEVAKTVDRCGPELHLDDRVRNDRKRAPRKLPKPCYSLGKTPVRAMAQNSQTFRKTRRAKVGKQWIDVVRSTIWPIGGGMTENGLRASSQNLVIP